MACCSLVVSRRMVPEPPSSPPGEPGPSERSASLLQVVGAVFWSFFGVRKGHAMQRDAVRIKPAQVIVVGIVLAAVLVVTLLLLVRTIIRHAT